MRAAQVQARGLVCSGAPSEAGASAAEAPAHQQPLHPPADHGQRPSDLGVARPRRRMKRQRAPGCFGEHPVQHEGVKVQVHVQPAAGALQRRDHAGLPTPNAILPGTSHVHVEQDARIDAQQRPAQPVIHAIWYRSRYGTLRTHRRTGTHGSTASTRWAARSVIRRPPQLGRRQRAQEDLRVLGDDLVEHGVLGVAGPVGRSLEEHGPQGRPGR
jgi:hypothetical protein